MFARAGDRESSEEKKSQSSTKSNMYKNEKIIIF